MPLSRRVRRTPKRIQSRENITETTASTSSCPARNEKDPLKRFTDENRIPVLNEVIDRGVHVCTKKGSDEIIRAASRRRRLLGLH